MAGKRSRSEEPSEDPEHGDTKQSYVPRYTPGKRPRSGTLPKVDYVHPLDPTEELITDLDWTIPKLNLFIAFTLDNLVDAHKTLFKHFIKLPSRKFHPQYYYKIDQPISINEIKSRDYEYNGGETKFLLDCELVYKNCLAYNDPDCLIVKNAKQVVYFIKNEVLKVKNATKNFLVNDDVKTRLISTYETLLNVTDKKMVEILEEDEAVKSEPALIENLDDTLRICQPFLELVDKDEYPEYEEVIRLPSSLNMVKNNLELGYYHKIYDFVTDVNITFQNALIFNDEDTTIYSDASKLMRCFNALIQKRFFPDLETAREKGEITLEYDKIEYKQFVQEEEEEEPILSDDDETNEEYNHIEGLGNGYNRGLMSRDYLLGPSKTNKTADSKADSSESDKPLPLKFNILPVIKKHNIEAKLSPEPYNVIQKIQISSSRSFYEQSIRPLKGMYQNADNNSWFEYIFADGSLSQNSNKYSITLPPKQNSVTFISHLSSPVSEENPATLIANKDRVNPIPVLNGDKFDESKARYDIKLAEGLNTVTFSIKNLESDSVETANFWLSVLP
ncbi:unnamed protein product [Kluyveromyces dobzhanskii CBS 2104]|uniref:WGS project CCBQ000000000 data, contig 00017 n=1 Tax=Kluyveromyces dobzhanskii CBS 2104 TaxID=1427455 RepID=A0A0A8L8J7_9SACH|nr:unnamed protein product [Kluyveromyces dobzhanskii CBS 2104]